MVLVVMEAVVAMEAVVVVAVTLGAGLAELVVVTETVDELSAFGLTGAEANIAAGAPTVVTGGSTDDTPETE